MKNSIRLASAILAAMLCATVFSACANGAKPPVAEVTTEAPSTDAPITDTPAITTDVPPATTEVPAVTENPDITVEKSTLRDLLYCNQDGYIKIKGCDSVSLPASGTWLKLKNEKIEKFFASELAYIIADGPKTNNIAPEWKSENNEIYLSYNNGTCVAVFAELEKLGTDVGSLKAANKADIRNLLLTEKTSVFLVGNVVITINNGGKQIYSFDISELWLEYFGYISFVITIDENTFYLVGSPRIASGTYYTEMIVTRDAGKSFLNTASYTSRNMDPMKYTVHNGKLYLSDITGGSVSELFVRLTDTKSFKNIVSGMQVSPNSAIAYTPYFDNGIGVWQSLLFSTDEAGKAISYYVFYISLDNGVSWEIYDPSDLINVDKTIEIDYLDLR